MRRVRGLCAAVFSLFGLLAGAEAVVPPPFQPLSAVTTSRGVEVTLWGRSYRFESGPLPTYISSQGIPVLGATPRIRGAGGTAVVWQKPIALSRTPELVLLRSVGQLPGLQVVAETTIEYDGMISVRLALTAANAMTLSRLSYELPLTEDVGPYFAHHLPYDYQVQNVDKERLLQAAGALPAAGLALGYVPTFALGNRSVGVEWWSETNANWKQSATRPVFEVRKEPGIARLVVNPIVEPLALASGQIWRDTFTLFVFPSRPPPARWRSVRFVPYTRMSGFARDIGTRFVFVATEADYRPRFDGLPGSTDDSAQRSFRSELARVG